MKSLTRIIKSDTDRLYVMIQFLKEATNNWSPHDWTETEIKMVLRDCFELDEREAKRVYRKFFHCALCTVDNGIVISRQLPPTWWAMKVFEEEISNRAILEENLRTWCDSMIIYTTEYGYIM